MCSRLTLTEVIHKDSTKEGEKKKKTITKSPLDWGSKHESIEVMQTKATTLQGFAAFICVTKVKIFWRIEETNEFTD